MHCCNSGITAVYLYLNQENEIVKEGRHVEKEEEEVKEGK